MSSCHTKYINLKSRSQNFEQIGQIVHRRKIQDEKYMAKNS